MSASFSVDDKDWINSAVRGGEPSELDITILTTVFDQHTDMDCAVIEKRMKKEAQLKKVCLYKMILFPFDYPLIYLFFGADKARDRLRVNKTYLSYYRKKISLEKFEKELLNYIKNDKIV